MSRLFKEVAIIGPGLIGGSIALDLRKKKLAERVVAVSRHQETISFARKRRIIDAGARDLSVVRNADLVVLAVPVGAILPIAARLKSFIRPDCIVIDVGSVKGNLVRGLERLFPFYVGTHPLAGSHNQGIRSAASGLFQGSLCVLTPTPHTDRAALCKIARLWHKLGARTACLSAVEHDKAIAMVSHLPTASPLP